MAPTIEHWLLDEASESYPSAFYGLETADKGLLLAALRKKVRVPILIILPSRAEAHQTVDHLHFFLGEKFLNRVHLIAPIDFDYYRGLLPNPEVLCERNASLFHALNDPKDRIFVTTLEAVLQKCLPSGEFLRTTSILSPNDEVDRDALSATLIEAGYQRQPAALDPGVFAVRGGVVDIFCPLYTNPVRIELFGDLVDEIRFFEPRTQRSLDKIKKVFLVPVGQTLLPRGESFQRVAEAVKERLDHLGIAKAKRDELIEKVQNHQLGPEFSLIFPILSGGASSITEYFPAETLFVWDGGKTILDLAKERELPKLQKNHELFEKEPSAIASYDDLFLNETDLTNLLEQKPGVALRPFSEGKGQELTFGGETLSFAKLHEGVRSKQAGQVIVNHFAKEFTDWMEQGYRIHVVCHTRTNAERIRALFEPHGIRSQFHPEGEEALSQVLKSDFQVLHVWQGFVSESRKYPTLKIILLSEDQLFGQKKRVAKSAAWSSTKDPARLLSNFRDLKTNDFIVHRDHGIGKYLGLKTMNFQGVENDYVLLEYKDGDKLYIPVYRVNVLQKYVGSEGAAPALDKLGGDRWIKVKSKAQRAVAELAGELIQIQAKRKLIPAHAFAAPSEDYVEFEMEFPFDETPDQMKAIEDVMQDLSQSHPMDRLLCGDVGYGKTEVAMRAAYRAVLDGKQVAVLVPTTILAFQHFENFKRRFSNTPVRIEMVSRLRSSADAKRALDLVSEGKIDILIGTHRLLSSDVKFKDLGVLVVDEEHRFGVVHKERLKKMCESVHVLAMTATPIPRTLNMAMAGIKEVSIITTPPPDRLSIRTFVCRDSQEVVAEAIGNELARDGQVFFVHNRIESIFGVADELKKILPNVRIEVAHGQMDAETLEKKMLSFYQGEAQVLLTTSIIESGLDIPRANTILIDQAHYFGLAQLYQLRGRVGRSEKRAYCYLLIPGENLLSTEAKQRLQVIQRYSELGSGFNVASHDLEIRGAGDLLGKEQSGHLNAIGVDLYFELLEESIRALRGEAKKTEIEPEINMKIAASFPQDYLPDISERILLYRKLSSVENEEMVVEIEEEIRDRFGPLPEEVVNLLGLMRIKLYLKKVHVVRMSCGPKRTSLQFAPSTPASPERLVNLIQKDPDDRYSMTPDQKLVFEVKETDWRGQLTEIQRLCENLGVE